MKRQGRSSEETPVWGRVLVPPFKGHTLAISVSCSADTEALHQVEVINYMLSTSMVTTGLLEPEG